MVCITDTKKMIKENNKSKQYKNNKYEQRLIKILLYKTFRPLFCIDQLQETEDKNTGF